MKDTKLRSVNTHFWDDNYITILDPSEKLLFLYLLTNPLTNLIGVYEISLRRIGFDTGFDKDTLEKMLSRFSEKKKIFYYNGFILLANFLKNQSFNANMKKGADQRIDLLPDEIKRFILSNGLKGFERVRKGSKGFETLRKVEDEYEDEYEVEDEREVGSLSSIFISIEKLPEYLNDEIFLAKASAYAKTTSARAAELIPDFVASIEFDPEKNFRPLGKHKSHFQNWLKLNIKNKTNDTSNNKRAKRAEALRELK